MQTPLGVADAPALYLHFAKLLHHHAPHVFGLDLERLHLLYFAQSYLSLDLLVLASCEFLGYLLVEVRLLIMNLDVESIRVLEYLNVRVKVVHATELAFQTVD